MPLYVDCCGGVACCEICRCRRYHLIGINAEKESASSDAVGERLALGDHLSHPLRFHRTIRLCFAIYRQRYVAFEATNRLSY